MMQFYKFDGVVYAYDEDQVAEGLAKGKKKLSLAEVVAHLSRSAPDATQDTDNLRRRAYADPITGSDTLFAEAARMQVMGESGIEEVRTRATARFKEIQAQYPWPAK